MAYIYFCTTLCEDVGGFGDAIFQGVAGVESLKLKQGGALR